MYGGDYDDSIVIGGVGSDTRYHISYDSVDSDLEVLHSQIKI